MRSAAAVIVGLALAAILGLAVAALSNERPTAFTLGVARSAAIKVPPRATVCQTPIAVPADAGFDGVTFAVGTGGRPGSELDVTVRRDDERGPVLAQGTLPAGYRDGDPAPDHTVWTGAVPARTTIAVCLQNRGRRPAFLYGDAGAAARSSDALLDGEPSGSDVALDFERRSPRTVAALVPAMLDRAALFRAQLVGNWTYVLLALLALLAVPALLVAAVRAAERDPA